MLTVRKGEKQGSCPKETTYCQRKSEHLDYTFPKKEKLKSKKLIEKLFSEGESISKFPIKLIYLETELSKEVLVQTGVTVPKKNFKSAVKRNRIKRLLREAYRLNKPAVFNNTERTFAFLFLYLGKEVPSYPQVEKSMKRVLAQFIRQIHGEKVDP